MTRLLIVEDDEATRLVCARFFQRLGRADLMIDVAKDGEEAIEALARERYDAILSDYRMGLVSGLDVLATALARQPDAGRFLMSGFADPTVVEGARVRAKVHAFMEKPMSKAEFERELGRVADYLSSRGA